VVSLVSRRLYTPYSSRPSKVDLKWAIRGLRKETATRVALLGLGKMGSAIACLLQKSGHQLTVWNRTAAAAQRVAEAGLHVAATPAEAVRGVLVVFTMLADDAATKAVVFGANGILGAMGEGAIHVSLSTISVNLSRLLTESHQQHRQHFVAAPVFGRPNIAEQGKLWIVVGGDTGPVETVRPLLEAASRGITVVSDQPWRAHALKLGGNFMISAMIAGLSEAFIFADSQGIDPALFLDTVNNALFQSALYAQYSHTILNPPEVPGGTIALGSKDIGLFREAAGHLNLPLADLIAQLLHRAEEAGMKDQDWAVGQYRITQSTAGTGSGEKG
jgi:3-hydroxyisobutyrate dehydrogenase-like beta-hydroxyacid dehydrogenase